MTNTFFSFGTRVLRAGLPTVLGMLCLSLAAQTPARSAFDILEVGRWSTPPTKINPLATHHIVGGVGHDFGPKGIYEHQLRALRYAADHFTLPQPVLGVRK